MWCPLEDRLYRHETPPPPPDARCYSALVGSTYPPNENGRVRRRSCFTVEQNSSGAALTRAIASSDASGLTQLTRYMCDVISFIGALLSLGARTPPGPGAFSNSPASYAASFAAMSVHLMPGASIVPTLGASSADLDLASCSITAIE